MRQLWLLGAVLGAALCVAAENFPPLTGRVVDAADILSRATEADLTAQLDAYERASGNQIVVATIADLGGLDIADYGYQLGRHWGIGSKEHDTGALLIVAPAARKVRIEVGYGLEGELTDAMSSQIIQTRILPAFRSGNFDAGVRAGVDAIIATLGGAGADAGAEPTQTVKHAVPGAIFWLIILFIVLNSFGRRRRGGLARALFWGSVLSGMSGGRRNGRGGGFHGGGFGGGGGFRGGGGSFGGGGASGGW